MRILIVRLGAFGDIIHTLPLAADLAAAGHSVDWLCEDRWSVLLQGSSAVARVHELPRKAWQRHGRGLIGKLDDLRTLRRALTARDFDLAIDAQGLLKSALPLRLLSGARSRLGHDRGRARELSWLCTQHRVPCRATHVIDQQRALGIHVLRGHHDRGPWRFPLPAWPEAHAWAAEQDCADCWGLNVGAGWPTKVWPRERLIAFAAACAERGQGLFVIWGSPAEEEVADAICAAVPQARKAPPTDLPRLAALLARLELLVSGDTGPLHLALAVDTPAVGLFGPVPGERNGPRGRGYRFLQAPGAAWERKDVNKVDMGAIGVDQVLAAAEACLAERGQERQEPKA